MSSYTIRWFQPEDVDAFLDLYTDVFDEWLVGPAWFSWKYTDNPFLDHVPILVAERDDELVGARPFFALPMALSGDERIALQPADTMVHEDHRGRGLFTRMTDWAIDHYTDREPAFFFNFPNDQSLPGYRNLGWETVGEESRFYRIQHPERVLTARNGNQRSRVAGMISEPLVGAYNSLCEAIASQHVPRDISISEHETIPVSELASIYRRSIPNEIHAVRNETFLEWRFDNPHWEYTTYLTEDETEPVAVVVGDSVGLTTGIRVTRIVDVLPIDDDRTDEQMLALLARTLKDFSTSDVFVAQSSVFPSQVLGQLGFYSDEWPPLSYVTRGRTHTVRPLGEWVIDGVDIRQPRNWLLSFVELDTS